ncbi:hypothetical protein [Brevundimonas lenta]|uniref:Glutathione synthase/RimK-type ligase-like ATP-grasp enzyme n=1 Tax=Brevundimonas lenta TaxID=424796 RepID=A0A7W6JC73_9CAUL|nr:hypothetical protein [Brevundimonas lenta]MBB4082439.1 glutathione synthase/RimK-type ligase-like ATP-grasp enzyme [Brevundimonas lenta]
MAERVLVTGARAAAALDIARSLRAAGYEPHLADCSPARLARWSNSAGPVHRHASPVDRPADFAADMRGLVDRLEPVAIVPTCEEIFHVAALAEADGFASRIMAPRTAVLAELHAKDSFAALCGRLGLPAPPTRTADDNDTLMEAAAELGEVVLKPVWSRFGVQTLTTPGAAAFAALRPTRDNPWIVQKRVRGRDASFHALCHEGRVVAFAAYGSAWRAPGGAACAFRALEPATAAELRAMADALAAHVGRGQFACDVILDEANRPWLIECNPRATSGIHLFGRTAAFGRALMGQGVAEPVVDGCHLAPALWRYGLPDAVGGGRLMEWWRQRRDGNDVLSAPGDPWPALGALVDAAVFGMRARREGLTLAQAMTADIEWNGTPLEPERWARA